MQTFQSSDRQQTLEIARQLATQLRPGDVIAYRGGLGAGKTTFTTGLAQGLGIGEDVSSPTFALVHQYQGDNHTLFHFDMYRITDFDSLYSTGFFDYLDGDAILAVEWSENIEAVLPDDVITVTLQNTGESSRTITIEGGGRF